jgi:ribonuclease HI
MSVKKQKYYVVWQGHNPGIYTSWDECKVQVHNYTNAVYKSFESKAEAERAFKAGPETRKPVYAAKKSSSLSKSGIIKESLSVDAACSGNPGLMEYRGVWVADHAEIFHFGPVPEGTNNIGEFLAIIHGLALLQKQEYYKTPIYTDSKTAMSWVLKKKANTKLKPTSRNKELFEMIRRGEKWLKENKWDNPILKWDTKNWGEIPADFDRK